jgi:rRNA processing protein Krr1/Pno1
MAGKGMDMLLSGSEHAAVYHYLEGRRAQLKVDGLGF